MPLLHINLTNEKQEVDIGRDIKAQSMILRKIVVVRDALASEDVDNSELGLHIDLHRMINGVETLSNISQGNHIYVPVSDRNNSGDRIHQQFDFNIRFNAEYIPRKFPINLYKKNMSAVSFASGTDGSFDSVDLYFEYEELH